MEQPKKEKLNAEIALLEKALATLDEALRQPYSDLIRDASIQRFEYVFELAWKTMKLGADYMGRLCNSPREAIKATFKFQWIGDPENWFEAMEARNKTSHTYNEQLAQEVFSIAKKFPNLVRELLSSLQKI